MPTTTSRIQPPLFEKCSHVSCFACRIDPLYEDPRTEVRRLLDKYHYDRYKVYNFASELAQMTPPTQRVDARVERCGLARPKFNAYAWLFADG